ASESGGPSGYTATLSAGCAGTIAAGEQKSCTITNDDQPAHLLVKKHVVNDSGGSKTAADFSISVSGGAPTPASFAGSESGTQVTLNAGTYAVDETPVFGYLMTQSPDCTGTILPGDNKTCTV